MIETISEIKPGDLIEIESDRGGCEKAPCTKKVSLVSDTFFISDDKDDDGYYFPIDIKNYVQSVETDSGSLLHIFSQ